MAMLSLPRIALFCTVTLISLSCTVATANSSERQYKWGQLRENLGEKREIFADRQDNKRGQMVIANKGFYKNGNGTLETLTLNDRDFIVYTPVKYSSSDDVKRPLLIVLHGGLGRASQIQNYIGLDPLADQKDFIVAYLDGTKVSRKLSKKRKGWNAGGCCGLPEDSKVDDIGHITNVIDYMESHYNIDKNRVFGTGHSNGGMMTQRIFCETDLYASAVSISGTLQIENASCKAASGKKILNIHGAQDANLPPEGGHTTTGVNKETKYKSQDYAREIYERDGAQYDLLLLEGAEHKPDTINLVLIKTEGMTLPEKIVSYLGL